MAVQVKVKRGTTAQHSIFTGAQGEVTYDTTKKTLVPHDGTTAGGNPLATEAGLAAGVAEAKSYADSKIAIAVSPLATSANLASGVAEAKLYADDQIEAAFDAVTATDIPTSDSSDVQTKLTSYAGTLSSHTTTIGDHTSQLAANAAQIEGVNTLVETPTEIWANNIFEGTQSETDIVAHGVTVKKLLNGVRIEGTLESGQSVGINLASMSFTQGKSYTLIIKSKNAQLSALSFGLYAQGVGPVQFNGLAVASRSKNSAFNFTPDADYISVYMTIWNGSTAYDATGDYLIYVVEGVYTTYDMNTAVQRYDSICSSKVGNSKLGIFFVKDLSTAYGGRYRLCRSDDGVNFNIIDCLLPEGLMAHDASCIIERNGWLIVGVHDVIESAAMMQFYATKDMLTWVQSIVYFPDDLSSVYNSAISLYVKSDSLYVAWCYTYQEGAIENVIGDNTVYQRPAYMQLALDDVSGIITSSDSYSNMNICDVSSNETYFDPMIIYAESTYYVAIKNEYTTQIEIWKGTTLDTLTKWKTYYGNGVEAPSMLFNESNRTITIYASGYYIGRAALDILLYDAFRVTDNADNCVWSLAEYKSLYQARHPYIITMPTFIHETLKTYKSIVSPNWPKKRYLNFAVDGSGYLYRTDNPSVEQKGLQFFPHPRVHFCLVGDSSAIATQTYDMLPIRDQDCGIVFSQDNGVSVGFAFGTIGWGLYSGYKISNTSNGIPKYVMFRQIRADGDILNAWVADAYAADTMISQV